MFPERMGGKVGSLTRATRDKLVVFKLDDDIGTWIGGEDMESPGLDEEEMEEMDVTSGEGEGTTRRRRRLLNVEDGRME